MAMSRKHYRQFADAIRERWDAVAGEPHCAGTRVELLTLTHDLGIIFKADNSNFDAGKFRHAATGC